MFFVLPNKPVLIGKFEVTEIVSENYSFMPNEINEPPDKFLRHNLIFTKLMKNRKNFKVFQWESQDFFSALS